MESAPQDVRLAEYASLRAEIAQRSSFQHALITLNLTAVAGIIGFVLTKGASKSLLFLVPIISSTLGLIWLEHQRNVRILNLYIRVLWIWEPCCEPWRKSFRRLHEQTAEIFYYLAVGIVYGGASIAALIVRWPHANGDTELVRDIGTALTALFIGAYAALARLETKHEAAAESSGGKR